MNVNYPMCIECSRTISARVHISVYMLIFFLLFTQEVKKYLVMSLKALNVFFFKTDLAG